MDRIDKIGEDVADIRVQTAGIQQHLININGSVKRHEKEIIGLRNKTYRNRVELAKIGMHITGGGISASIIYILMKSLGM